MSIKSKVLAAAATLTLVSGVGAAGALTAGPAAASTPSCGGNCITVWNAQFGNRFVQDVFRQGEKVGQPIILFRNSNTDPAEDFTITDIANCSTAGPCTPYTVAQIAGVDPTFFPPAVVLRYATDLVYEVQYAPYGVDSGLCVGVAGTPTNGEPVSLQPCGVSADTFWIADASHLNGRGYLPFVNAGSANFTQPYVLTYPANGYPTDMPRPQMYIHTLQTYSRGQVYSNQMWTVR